MRRVVAVGLAWSGAAWVIDGYGRRRGEAEGIVSKMAQTHDAIVVLGCAVHEGGKPSPALVRRTELAARLYRQGRAPLLVTTGGVGQHPPSEALVAARYAAELGVPWSDILLEDRSTTTAENAAFTAKVLESDEAREVRRIVVVTDSYHLLRACRIFSKHFAHVQGVACDTPARERVRGSLREVPALLRSELRRRL